MKKLALLFSLILIAQSANAFIDTQYMKTGQFLSNTGYSAEMSNMIDFNSANPYRDAHVEKNDFKSLARRAYHYIVPGQNEDLDFYNHNGNFDNWSWKDF